MAEGHSRKKPIRGHVLGGARWRPRFSAGMMIGRCFPAPLLAPAPGIGPTPEPPGKLATLATAIDCSHAVSHLRPGLRSWSAAAGPQ